MTYWLQTLVGDDGRIGNLLKKTQCDRGDIPKEKVSAHEPIICTFFNPVDPANSLILVPQSARVHSLDHSSNGSTLAQDH